MKITQSDIDRILALDKITSCSFVDGVLTFTTDELFSRGIRNGYPVTLYVGRLRIMMNGDSSFRIFHTVALDVSNYKIFTV